MGIIMIYPKSIWSFFYEKFRQLKISTKAFLAFDLEKIIIFKIDLKDPPQYYTDQGVTAQKVWLAEAQNCHLGDWSANAIPSKNVASPKRSI